MFQLDIGGRWVAQTNRENVDLVLFLQILTARQYVQKLALIIHPTVAG
jgi:hypothetical protein